MTIAPYASITFLNMKISYPSSKELVIQNKPVKEWATLIFISTGSIYLGFDYSSKVPEVGIVGYFPGFLGLILTIALLLSDRSNKAVTWSLDKDKNTFIVQYRSLLGANPQEYSISEISNILVRRPSNKLSYNLEISLKITKRSLSNH